MKVQEFLLSENRFKMLTKSKPEEARRLFELAQKDADTRWQFYAHLSARKAGGNGQPTEIIVPPAKA
jgi:pyruvate-ferredoxin/flavodoxin oxidoreductase